jgi:hypothetical protein
VTTKNPYCLTFLNLKAMATNDKSNNKSDQVANVTGTIMIGGVAIAPKAIESNPLARKERAQKQGVIWAIGEILKAHASTGITKARVLEYLAAMYPERKINSLAQTITVQVPSRLASDRGFIIEAKDLPDGQRLYFYKGLKTEEAKK